MGRSRCATDRSASAPTTSGSAAPPSARAARSTGPSGASWATLGIFKIDDRRKPKVGVGLGAVEATIVFEQLGLHLVGGPLALVRRSRRRSSTARPNGDRLVGGLDAAADRGRPVLVEHAADIDALVCSTPDGVVAWDAPSCRRRAAHPARPADPGRPIRGAPGRRTRSATPTTRRACALLGTVLSAAMLLGVSDCRAGRRTRLRARARAVRRPDRIVPGDQAHAGRHVRANRPGPERDLCRRGGLRRPRRSATPHRAARLAKLLAGEAALANARGRGPGARRHGLHLGHAPELPAEAGVGARARRSGPPTPTRSPWARSIEEHSTGCTEHGLRDHHVRGRRPDRDDHVQPARPAQRASARR